MNDLTVIYLTENKLPKGWSRFQQQTLLEAIGDTPLISVSRKPMNFGLNILQTEPSCRSNIYWQILKACKIATTPYIAIAEDDCLYPAEHFLHRPKTFAYNMTHWSLFTWEPMYNWRNRYNNSYMIAPRELTIEALEERFAKWPNGTPDNLTGEIGRHMVEKNLGITLRDTEEFNTTIAVVILNHSESSEERQKRQRKRMGWLRAYSIPHWGEAEDILKKFK